MSNDELEIEWQYRFNERIGILTQGDFPTDEQIERTKREADEVVKRLKAVSCSQDAHQ